MEINFEYLIEQHTIVEDIFNCKENILCHQVNMKKRMGNGIAKQVKELFPNVYEKYNIQLKDANKFN